MVKKPLLVSLILLFLQFPLQAERQTLLPGVTVIYGEQIPDTWKLTSYDDATAEEVAPFIEMLRTEYAKYPDGYIVRARATNIVLVKGLALQGVNRAAVPDPYQSLLYLSIDGARGVMSPTYLIHVMHHELHHSVEYGVWKDMYYKWNSWAALNPEGFVYGPGGASAYEKAGDYYTIVQPSPGFANLYQTLGQEEDRSELVAWFMGDAERPSLHEVCRTDPIVKKKARLLVQMMNRFAGTAPGTTYWEKQNGPCLN